MIRLYKEFVELILLVLRLAKKCEPEDGYYAHSLQYAAGRSDPQNLDELISLLTEQFQQNGNIDRDLIDLIVETLRLPYAENRLDSSVITKLRKALLLPSEFNALKEQLQRQEITCPSCDRVLSDGEMTTLIRDGRNVSYHCVNCSSPLFIPCEKGHLIEVSNKVRNTLKRLSGKCKACERGEAENEAPDIPTPLGSRRGIRTPPLTIDSAAWHTIPLQPPSHPTTEGTGEYYITDQPLSPEYWAQSRMTPTGAPTPSATPSVTPAIPSSWSEMVEDYRHHMEEADSIIEEDE